MKRYFIELAFKGVNYHGWQMQPNAPSVQGELEKALQMLLKTPVKTTGAGRTDTGVHACFYVAHFDVNDSIAIDNVDLVYKLNAVLPGDIAIYKIYPVKTAAHARFSAVSRTYKYTISKRKDPFLPDFSWYFSLPLNIPTMNHAAAKLLDYEDFTSFSKLHSDVKTNLCKIYDAGWKEEELHLIFTIRGNRFLRNMVRSIVGTMIDIGRERIDLNDFSRIIEGRNRNLAGFSVPAHGLSLTAIEYFDNIKL